MEARVDSFIRHLLPCWPPRGWQVSLPEIHLLECVHLSYALGGHVQMTASQADLFNVPVRTCHHWSGAQNWDLSVAARQDLCSYRLSFIPARHWTHYVTVQSCEAVEYQTVCKMPFQCRNVICPTCGRLPSISSIASLYSWIKKPFYVSAVSI